MLRLISLLTAHQITGEEAEKKSAGMGIYIHVFVNKGKYECETNNKKYRLDRMAGNFFKINEGRKNAKNTKKGAAGPDMDECRRCENIGYYIGKHP